DLRGTALSTATEAIALHLPPRGLRQLIASGPFLRALRRTLPRETWDRLQSWADENGATPEQSAARHQRLPVELPAAIQARSDARACAPIFHTIGSLGYDGRCRVIRGALPQALEQLGGDRFDLVFSDPPYASRAAQQTVEALAVNQLLAPAARVVLEMDRREPAPAPPAGLRVEDERRYGDTRVLIL